MSQSLKRWCFFFFLGGAESAIGGDFRLKIARVKLGQALFARAGSAPAALWEFGCKWASGKDNVIIEPAAMPEKCPCGSQISKERA